MNAGPHVNNGHESGFSTLSLSIAHMDTSHNKAGMGQYRPTLSEFESTGEQYVSRPARCL